MPWVCRGLPQGWSPNTPAHRQAENALQPPQKAKPSLPLLSQTPNPTSLRAFQDLPIRRNQLQPPIPCAFSPKPCSQADASTPARSAWKCLACKRAENHFSHRFQHRRAKVVKGKVRGSGVGWRWPELLAAQTALGLGQLPALPWEIGSRFALQTRWNISPVPGARERQTSLTHQPPCSFPLLQTPRGAGAEPAGGPGLGKRLEEPGEQFALLG